MADQAVSGLCAHEKCNLPGSVSYHTPDQPREIWDHDFVVRLPECDEWGVPKEKMPRCPQCNADELGMLTPGRALCYACGLRVRN